MKLEHEIALMKLRWMESRFDKDTLETLNTMFKMECADDIAKAEAEWERSQVSSSSVYGFRGADLSRVLNDELRKMFEKDCGVRRAKNANG